MLLSMTGFGEASRQNDSLAVSVEVRTINSRYFKLTVRSGEGYAALEPQIDALVRQHIKRGTVQVSLRVTRLRPAETYQINAEVLAGYRRQLQQLAAHWAPADAHNSYFVRWFRQQFPADPVRLEALLPLPGVVLDNEFAPTDPHADWPLIEEALAGAMANMAGMRADEGRAMTADLAENCSAIAAQLAEIERRAPLVADAYRGRLNERLGKILAEFDVALQPGDLVREVGIYAERSDISEETVRLRSHLEQFATIMALEESSGRKLEFLTQEMFRETNTIGSKANDVLIARHVIEIKAAIERMREMIQNIE